MKKITGLLVVFTILGCLTGGFANGSGPNDSSFKVAREQIIGVISDQIQAFELQDVDRAYHHASQSIKKLFESSEIFGQMVRNSYPMIWDPAAFEFLRTVQHPGGYVQRMMFKDSSGQVYFFDYMLERAGNRWVIAGVYPSIGSSGV